MMRELLIATHNPGKIREYQTLLDDLPLAITSLRALGILHDVEETGQSFVENAVLKAQTYARLSGLWTWADDSGLAVDALNGQPGIYSARYAGEGATDRDRYQKLLAELRPIAQRPWKAYFHCAVAIATPAGDCWTVEASIAGEIIEHPRGEHGFGYDPVFWMAELGVTMAELTPDVKNRISHRGQAAAQAKAWLRTQLSERLSS